MEVQVYTSTQDIKIRIRHKDKLCIPNELTNLSFPWLMSHASNTSFT